MEEEAVVCVPKLIAFMADYYLEKEASSGFSADFFYDTSVPKYLMLITRKTVYNSFMRKVENEFVPVYTIKRQKGALMKIYKNTIKKLQSDGSNFK